ncbi:hypothetical protein Hanom_Chr01g00060831 [Helianthus anomalus]
MHCDDHHRIITIDLSVVACDNHHRRDNYRSRPPSTSSETFLLLMITKIRAAISTAFENHHRI